MPNTAIANGSQAVIGTGRRSCTVGSITRDVSGEVAQYYDYSFLSKATGRSAEQLGLKQ